jgi:glycyl-tRNA synthetase beta chain
MNETEKRLSFLLEIGTEDLPARFINPALEQLKQITGNIFKENRLSYKSINVYGTPRRLAIIAEGVPYTQEDSVKEIFGPSKKVAFDESGKPTKALIGFAQSQGVRLEDLAIKTKGKGEYVVAIKQEKGLPTEEILPEIFKSIITSLHFPKTMRWGDGNLRFARPIRWIVAIADGKTIEFEIDGIKSSNITRGHRFLSPASFQVKDIKSYKKLLTNNHVIVDPEERKKIIREGIIKALSIYNEKIIEDEDLLDTVNNLVEYPVPVIASFPEKYLTLPKELLITVMKGHQKYFAVENSEGNITNHFIVISNSNEDNSENVKTGAERVIKARFEDARFYFEEDRKKPLKDRIEELKRVIFHEDLGNLYQKTERLVSISQFLSEKVYPSLKDKIIQAAWLSKTDLLTGIVREFPELQGTIGKYYAILDGEDKDVAIALEEQYLPQHSRGKLPNTTIGALLSIAEKIDNITAFFSIGLIPSGSEDPYALRRQAFGIIEIILKMDFNFTLSELIDTALKHLNLKQNFEDVKKDILKFFSTRFEYLFSEMNYPYDLIQSVMHLLGDTNLVDIKLRLDSLLEHRENKDFNEFLTAIKRVKNIIPSKVISIFKEELIIEEAERKLNEAVEKAEKDIEFFIKDRDFKNVIKTLISLKEPINYFFDNVLVMDKNEDIRNNRLSLLCDVWKTVLKFADPSEISINY